MSVLNENIDSTVDDRFGLSPFFCMYNLETKQIEYNKNSMRNSLGSGGPQLVELCANIGLNKDYALEFGFKAKEMLDKFKIEYTVSK